jgi:tape measure domain-containing protein
MGGAMIIGDMEIRLRADIARLQRDMDSARRVVSDASTNISRAADRAKAALAGIAAGIGISQIVQMSDAYAKFTAQLKLASLSAREYAAAYVDVKRISTQSTQGLQETAVLYARIANGTRELGTTQKQVAAITETVNLSLLVSGASASEAASAQLQLSQAFASGTLRGEEFNAVNEAAPRLMLALADGIGVPVGALKKMAEEGAITSQIMADVLPNALAKLRQEGKEVQTISGAFTVLKNNMMEFVGVQSNASGAVSAMTGAIGFLANNLTLLAGAVATVTVAKLATWLSGMVTSSIAAAAANRALAASTLANAVATTGAAATIASAKLAEAQANVRATAASAALAAARVTELRTAVLAASGTTQLALVQNGLIPAQARAAALAQANATALAAQAVAAAGATTAAVASTAALSAQAAASTLAARAMGVLNGVMAFFGGPIGMIITLLGAAATAWMVYGNKAKESNEKAVTALDESTTEMILRLDKQIEKLKERNRLQDTEPRIKGLNDLSDADRDGLARAKAKLDEIRSKPLTGLNGLAEIEALHLYETALKRVGEVQAEVTAAATRGRDGKLKEWFAQNGSAAQRMAAELAELKKQFGEIPPEMEKIIRARYAEKAIRPVVKALREETDAYKEAMRAAQEKADLRNKEYEEIDAYMKAQQDGFDAAVKGSRDALQAAKDEYAQYGLSKSQIAEITLLKLESAKASFVEGSAGYVASQKQIDAQRELIGVLQSGEARDANAKVVEETRRAQVSMWESIDKTAHDTFVSIFDSGKSAFDRLKDTLKNGLLDMLYQMTIKKWIFNIEAAVTGSGASAPGAADGGVSGTIASAKKAYEAITSGFSSISTSVAKGVQSALTSSGVSTGTASSIGSYAGTAAGYAGGAAVGVYGGRAISNGYAISGSGNGLVNAGTAVGAIVGGPIGAAIGGLIAGAANRLFGRKAKEVTSSTLTGSFGASGFSGTTNDSWIQKGGVFRSDKRGTDRTAVATPEAKAMADAYAYLRTASADFATALGVNADAVKTRTQSMSIALTKDQAANEKAIAEFFANVANNIATELVPSISSFSKAGESASATLERIAGNSAFVDVALKAMDKTFGAVGVGSIAARERLIDLVGGIEALGQGTAFFAQNFLTEAERLAPVAADLKRTLADMGLAFVDSREEFKAVVMSLDPSKAGDAEKLAGLFKVQQAFAAIYPAAEAAASGMEERADLQRQLDELMLTSSQRLAKQRAALSESNRGLFDQVQALTAAKAAQDAARASLGDMIGRLRTFGDSARALKDSLLVGSLSTLTPEQQYAETRRQYEATLAAAKAGDATAQSNFASMANAFLSASQRINGGDSMYSADFANVLRTSDEMSKWSAREIDVAQASLNAQEAQLAALMQLNTTVAQNIGAGALVGTVDRELAYGRMGTADMAPLTAEIKALRAEVVGLRADQSKQTGDLIGSSEEIQRRSSDAIVQAVQPRFNPKKYEAELE